MTIADPISAGTISSDWGRQVADSLNGATGVQSAVDATLRTTTSTTFTNVLTTANIVGVTFTAPASGKVRVYWSAGMFNSGTGYCATGFAVKSGTTVGSGTTFLASAIERATRHDGTVSAKFGDSYLVTGLTAGDSYNVSLEHAVASGTGSFERRVVSVDGLPT